MRRESAGGQGAGQAMDRQNDEDAERAAERRRMLLDILRARLHQAHQQMMADYAAPGPVPAPVPVPRRPRPAAGPLRGSRNG